MCLYIFPPPHKVHVGLVYAVEVGYFYLKYAYFIPLIVYWISAVKQTNFIQFMIPYRITFWIQTLLFIVWKLEFKQTEEEKGLITCLDLTINRHTDHITIEIYRETYKCRYNRTIHIKPPNGTRNSGLEVHNKHSQQLTHNRRKKKKKTRVTRHNKYSWEEWFSNTNNTKII